MQVAGLAGAAVAVVVLVVAVMMLPPQGPPNNNPNGTPGGTVCPTDFATNRCGVILTASGTIVFEIQETLAPATSSHFIALMQSGYYTGLPWHRVEDWVIQTGQGPQVGTIDLETTPELENVRGAVAVARTSDPNSGSSQFYILRNDAHHLDGSYAVFGMVKLGMDAVDSVTLDETISAITVVDHYPV
jgi:cyclophilin family peptidyl-prolyl cis-trans isomerase